MTKREIINKYFPQLIMIMANPAIAIQFCQTWCPKSTLMGNLVNNVPNEMIMNLFDIIKTAKYKENPKPLIENMNRELKEAK